MVVHAKITGVSGGLTPPWDVLLARLVPTPKLIHHLGMHLPDAGSAFQGAADDCYCGQVQKDCINRGAQGEFLLAGVLDPVRGAASHLADYHLDAFR